MNNKDYHDLFNVDDNWVFKNFRSFDFILELYPDNDEHSYVIDYINLFALDDGFDFRYILHDKDVKEDGTPVKEHWHVYIRYDYNKSCSAVIKDLGVPHPKWIRDCDSKSIFIRYLCHYDNPEKFPYSISAVHTNILDFENLPLWRKPRKTKKDGIFKELKGEDGLTNCLLLVDNLFYSRGQKGVTQNLVIKEIMNAGLYKHLCGHRDLIFRYYDGLKYNR